MSATSVNANQQTLRKLVVVAAAMFGFGFLLVPFYKKICEVTGLNNIVQEKGAAPVNTQVDTSRWVTLELDSNVGKGLDWEFRALAPSVRFNPGALTRVEYEIRNNSSRTITGQAIPSYGPSVVGRHIHKMDCFCFQMHTLAPGEVKRLPVVFVIDPELPGEVNTATLSYTFFEVAGKG